MQNYEEKADLRRRGPRQVCNVSEVASSHRSDDENRVENGQEEEIKKDTGSGVLDVFLICRYSQCIIYNTHISLGSWYPVAPGA